ncbi:hypothetical protein QJS10_CPB22g00636 [Acorus calamus]|uniref:TITAN-like protein n=1 Tax=Acorus calamus TaxID=4465 RepID=A0AAV9BX81_ACOCL|nr:hypothetical protein QJS10_CPB22g00636 [Acorus calamus]
MADHEKAMKKNKRPIDAPFELCKVCNLSHNQGRKHVYLPSHARSLSALLHRFSRKLSDLRFFLDTPSVLRPEHAPLNRLWCPFCDRHMKKVKEFLWMQGGGMDRADSFRISKEDLAKWEKGCRALNKATASSSCEGTYGPLPGPTEDIQFHKCSFGGNHQIGALANIDGQWGDRLVCFEYEQNWLDEVELAFLTTGLLNNQGQKTDIREGSTKALQNLKQLSTICGEHIGNVHSGAPPPWLDDEEKGYNTYLVPPSGHEVKPHKSHNLNPKRVGAAWAEKRRRELEMEKNGEIAIDPCDKDWLPNFGRVWQTGSRKDSRREFEMEKQKSVKVDSHAQTSLDVQPYISKRMGSRKIFRWNQLERMLGGVKISINGHAERPMNALGTSAFGAAQKAIIVVGYNRSVIVMVDVRVSGGVAGGSGEEEVALELVVSNGLEVWFGMVGNSSPKSASKKSQEMGSSEEEGE